MINVRQQVSYHRPRDNAPKRYGLLCRLSPFGIPIFRFLDFFCFSNPHRAEN
jgi:hypothetical protein